MAGLRTSVEETQISVGQVSNEVFGGTGAESEGQPNRSLRTEFSDLVAKYKAWRTSTLRRRSRSRT